MKKSNKNIKSQIRTGDTVKVIAGDSKGETGVVEKILIEDYRALVKGVNMVKRHVRPSAEQPGGIVEKEASIHISNLMLVDADGTASRIKRERDENGRAIRVSKKTQQTI